MTRYEPPRDVWQLCERAVDMVPLTVAKMETLLGTPMVEDPQDTGQVGGRSDKTGPVVAGDILGHRNQGRRVVVRGDQY